MNTGRSDSSRSSFSERTLAKSSSLTDLKSMRGILKKKGFWSNWREGYFVMEGNLLLEFKSENAAKPVKLINLEKYTVKLADTITGAPYSFGLFSTNHKDPIFLCAANEADRVEWVSAIGSRTKDGAIEWGPDSYLEAFNDAVVQSSEKGVILGCNESFLKMTGYVNKSEIMGKNIHILMPMAHAKIHDNYVNNYLDTGIKRIIGKPRRVPVIKADGTEMMAILSLGEVMVDGARRFVATMKKDETERLRKDMIEDNMAATVDAILKKAGTEIQEGYSQHMLELYTEMEGIKARNKSLVRELKKLGQRPEHLENKEVPLAASNLKVNYENIQIHERIAEIGGSGAAVFGVTVDGWGACMKELNVDGVDPVILEAFVSEIEVLETLPYHKNVVRYLFHTRSESKLRLFMTRYASSLTHVLKIRYKEHRYFTCGEFVKLALDIAKGLEVIHAQSIMHRDLKSDNIFVMFNSSGAIDYLSVGDFDTAKVVSDEAQAKTTVGTPGYCSPEILRSHNIVSYGFASDIWSYGMVLYELMTLTRPFATTNLFAVTALTIKGELPALPKEVEAIFYNVIPVWKKCLQLDPAKRPSAKDLKHMLLSLME